MRIGVARLVELAHRVEHNARLLRSRGRVEVVDVGICGEKGEIGPAIHCSTSPAGIHASDISWPAPSRGQAGPTRTIPSSIFTAKPGRGSVAGPCLTAPVAVSNLAPCQAH